MIIGVVTPTETGTTTVVTTTTSSGAYTNLSTFTTSLPSSCPGIVNSRQQTTAFVMKGYSNETISSNGFLGMGIYAQGVPQDGSTSVRRNPSEVGQVYQEPEKPIERWIDIKEEVDSTMECCKSRCKTVMKEINRVENSNEMDHRLSLIHI